MVPGNPPSQLETLLAAVTIQSVRSWRSNTLNVNINQSRPMLLILLIDWLRIINVNYQQGQAVQWDKQEGRGPLKVSETNCKRVRQWSSSINGISQSGNYVSV